MEKNRFKIYLKKNKQRLKEYEKNYHKAKKKHKTFFFFFLHSIKWNKKL